MEKQFINRNTNETLWVEAKFVEKGILLVDKTNGSHFGHMYFTREKEFITVTETVVDRALRGQGIAKDLIQVLIAFATDNHLKIKATCTFIRDYFAEHPSDLYVDTPLEINANQTCSL